MNKGISFRKLYSQTNYLDREFDSNKEMERAYYSLVKEWL